MTADTMSMSLAFVIDLTVTSSRAMASAETIPNRPSFPSPALKAPQRVESASEAGTMQGAGGEFGICWRSGTDKWDGLGRDAAAGQARAEAIAGPRKPAAHRTDWPAQLVGGHFMRHPFEVAEHHHGAVFLRKTAKLLLDHA